jgi:hypothetical protein
MMESPTQRILKWVLVTFPPISILILFLISEGLQRILPPLASPHVGPIAWYLLCLAWFLAFLPLGIGIILMVEYVWEIFGLLRLFGVQGAPIRNRTFSYLKRG